MKLSHLIFALSSLSLPVIAADITWDTADTSNAWNALASNTNWVGDLYFSSGDNVTFNSAGGETVTVDAGGVTAGTIAVGANNGAWTFTGGSIASTGALTKSGTGTLTLGSANSFSSVALNGGALTISNIGALGSGTLTVGSGANGPAAEPGSGTAGSFLYLSGFTTGTFANAIVLPNDATSAYRKITVTGGTGGNIHFSGVISGGGAGTTFYLDNTAGDSGSIIRLSGTNTFVGKVEFNRGSMQIDSDAALGGSSNQLIADGYAASKFIFNYSGNYTHATSIQTNTNFDVGGTNSITASGAFSGNTMTKVGTGTLTFTVANSYGATVVSAGTLALSGSGTLGGTSSAVTANTGGTLNLGTKSISAGAVTFGGGTVQNGTLTGTSYTSTGGTVSATLAGTGKLTHSGTGALTLSGPNTYSGGTAINGGPASNSSGSAGVVVTNGSALGTGAITLGNTGSIAAIYTNGTGITLNNNIALSSSAVTTALIGKTGTTQTYGGVISGGNTGATLFINMDASASNGVLKLANTANTFTVSKITTNRGVIAITADGSLGASTNTLFLDNTSLNGGLRFDEDNINIIHPVQFNDYATINVNGRSGSTISSNITGSAGNRGTAYTISGGTLTLSGTNTFYHKLDVAANSTLKLGNASALGNAAEGATDGTNVSNGGVLDLNGQAVGTETVTLNGTGISSGGALVNSSATNASLSGSVALASNSSVGGTGNTSLSGVVSGAFDLSKVGAGILTLTNTNTFTGQTNVNAGTLELSNGNAIADAGAVSIANVAGATLKLNASETIGSLAGGGATGGTVDLQANTLTTGNATNTTFAGSITGTGGSLVKQGSGTLTLSGTSTYTGTTTVSVGTLLVSGALGDTDVVVNNGAMIGGAGTIEGSLNLDSGALLLVTLGSPLTVTGNVSFDGFGFSNISGWDYENAEIGEYTLIAGSDFTFTNVSNFGFGNALTLGNGNKIYFDSGSLKAVVAIPEPAAALLGGLGILALLRRRR